MKRRNRIILLTVLSPSHDGSGQLSSENGVTWRRNGVSRRIQALLVLGAVEEGNDGTGWAVRHENRGNQKV